jgi:formylglycine-generating enzyme required for sulfatase activity
MIIAALSVCILLSLSVMNRADQPAQNVNSIGMTLVRIAPGSFEMGVDSVPLPPELTKGLSGVSWDRPDGNGDYDEAPVHKVTITQPLLMSQTEVTVEEFRQFKPDYQPSEYWAPFAAGISWHDANAFCEWLSKKEGKPYRLPTEAEWEFACRAGTRTAFSSGARPDPAGVANPWGLMNMQAGVAEWVHDWHGRYADDPQTDPVGPATGYAKVIRGGGLDHRANPRNDGGKKQPAESPYYQRSANRASASPDFASPSGHIGFRVVQADLPKTAAITPEPHFFQTAIKQSKPDLKVGPDLTKPYLRIRPMFPDLGERNMRDVGWKLGLAPGLGQAYHNSAVAVCDNGDLIAAYYNTLRWENEVDQSILTMRLRYGSDEWDMPEPWPDFVDAADCAPIFWNDKGRLWFFWGLRSLIGGPPFQYMTSTDNGATWSAVQTPKFENQVGAFTPQPVNSIIQDHDGSIYVPVDGDGNDTGLFATSNGGKTWRDTGGRSAGRHTTYVLGKDGSFIGFGGKNSNIDGKMPKSISHDKGKTYVNTATEFMPLAGGQRPSVIRLQSGRLFFVADTLSSRVPGGRTASLMAISDDDGLTWKRRDFPIASTCGYVTATQAPNGIIHIVTSKTKPVLLHVEMNELYALEGGEPTPQPTTVGDVRSEKENHANGKPKAEWSGGFASDGNYRLQGKQTFYYENGFKHWESSYVAGKRTGTETYWGLDGKKRWERAFGADGPWTWRTFDRDGKVTAESKWNGKSLVDPGNVR